MQQILKPLTEIVNLNMFKQKESNVPEFRSYKCPDMLRNNDKSLNNNFLLEQFQTADDRELKILPPKRTRIIARKGIEHFALFLNDIALFYTQNKIAFAIDKNGKKFLCEKKLSNYEDILDNNRFFRANRQFIINIDYIKSFRPYERAKIWVDLVLNDPKPAIIISQETAPCFRKWINEG